MIKNEETVHNPEGTGMVQKLLKMGEIKHGKGTNQIVFQNPESLTHP